MATVSLDEIRRLSTSERIQLAQDIWDSIAAEPESVPLTDEQREELDRRLMAYAKEPESGNSWEQVKKRLLKAE